MKAAPTAGQTVARLRAAGCVYAEDEAALLIDAAADAGALAGLVERRVAGEPLEQILGWAEFRGLRLIVAPGVFVPRARTGLLVSEAARLSTAGATVLDLCCGVGAIGAALLAETQLRLQVCAVDLDPAATACAAQNLAGTVYTGDLYQPLPPALLGQVQLIVANAPYVPTGEIELMPSEARDYERRPALDGGADGLDVQRRIAADAPSWLAAGGRLLIETSRHQAAATSALFEAAGLAARTVRCDELDATVVIGTRP